MKKTGFTLAEVLITMTILGVIAALTIPTLVQNTQRKEEVVQIQKGFSTLNQAVAMNYAINRETLNDYNLTANDAKNVLTMLKENMNVVSSGTEWIKTQDGITFYFGEAHGNNACTSASPIDENGAKTGTSCFGIIISTKTAGTDTITSYQAAQGKLPSTTNGVLSGYYQFYASANSIAPVFATQKILTSSNVSNLAASELTSESGGNT